MKYVQIGLIVFVMLWANAVACAQCQKVEEESRDYLRQIDRQILDVMHNLTKSRTPGFKQRIHEEEGYPDPNGEGNPDLLRIDIRQGAIVKTGRPLDIAVQGEGFFQFIDGRTNETVYTRCGSLEVGPNGNLCLVKGNVVRLLDPAIVIPEEAKLIDIREDGQVWTAVDSRSEWQNVGQIQLSTFIAPTRLKAFDDRFFFQTDFSGPPTEGDPGLNGYGVLKPKSLERSNVDTEESLRELKRLKTIRQAFEEILE